MGSHTPVTDEHGERLDYYCDNLDEDSSEQTWERIMADTPINQQLARLRQEQREEAALQGPTQAVTPAEEEKLLAGDSGHSNFVQLMQGLEGLPESALNQLSQHIDEIRRQTPSMASPAKSPGPLPGLPISTAQNSEMAQKLMKVTQNLGQLPSGARPVTFPPGEEETKLATDIIEAQMKAPGTPLRKTNQ